MKAVVLGYYSSVNISGVFMLKGLLLTFSKFKKFYLPVVYPSLETFFLRLEKLDKNIEVFSFLNALKLIRTLFTSERIFFLLGDNLTGMYGIFSSMFTFLNLLPILFFGKKSIILPSTILPSKFNKKILRLFLSKAREIYVREKNTLSEVRRINKHAFLADDLSIFYLKKMGKRMGKIKKQDVITIAIRNTCPRLMKIDSKKFILTISKQLELILKKKRRYRIILLPLQIGVRKKNDDRVILKEIHNSVHETYKKKMVLINQLVPSNDILKIIRKSKVLVSSRFHPCVFASILKTHFIVIPESLKVKYFARVEKGLVVKKNELSKLHEYIQKFI